MKVFKVEFDSMWPVPCALAIAAKDLDEAIEITKKTIHHTDKYEIIEIDLSESGVILYESGDY